MATVYDRRRRPVGRTGRPAPAPVNRFGFIVDVVSVAGAGAALTWLTSVHGIYWGGLVLGVTVAVIFITYGIRSTRQYSIAVSGLVPIAVACLFSAGLLGFERPVDEAPAAPPQTKEERAGGRAPAAPQAAPAAPQQAKEPVAGKEAAPAPTAAPEPPKQAEGKAEAAPVVYQAAPAPEKAAEGRAEEPAKEAGGKGTGKQSGGKVQP